MLTTPIADVLPFSLKVIRKAHHMIITRTPLRISFFGGGTDYPVWYREHGGAVLATTINKRCYVTCRQLAMMRSSIHR